MAVNACVEIWIIFQVIRDARNTGVSCETKKTGKWSKEPEHSFIFPNEHLKTCISLIIVYSR